MDSAKLTWETASHAGWYWYFTILFFLIFCASVCSEEMKRRTRYILAAVSICALLCLPIFRRVSIQDYVENKGYTLIVQRGVFLNRYVEEDLGKYLWRVFGPKTQFLFEHEHKLIFLNRGGVDFAPGTIDMIEFAD